MHRKGRLGDLKEVVFANGLSNSVISSESVHNTQIHRCVQNQLLHPCVPPKICFAYSFRGGPSQASITSPSSLGGPAESVSRETLP